jgi:hypothetical protein
MPRRYKCPNCGSDEFITEPNRYDIMTFSIQGFQVIESATIDDYKVFCRECSEEVDISLSSERVLLKKS